jgi:hypothetical protein
LQKTLGLDAAALKVPGSVSPTQDSRKDMADSFGAATIASLEQASSGMSSSPDLAECPFCGKLIPDIAVDCPQCGSYLGEDGRMVTGRGRPDEVLQWLVPIGRSGWAIVSGYLALGGFVPLFGIAFGLAAALTGLLALRSLRKRPHLGGRGRAWFGIIVGFFTAVANIVFFSALALRR